MAMSLGGVSVVEVVREEVGGEAQDHGAEVDAVHAGAPPGLLHDGAAPQDPVLGPGVLPRPEVDGVAAHLDREIGRYL